MKDAGVLARESDKSTELEVGESDCIETGCSKVMLRRRASESWVGFI